MADSSRDHHEAVLEFNLARDRLHQEIVALQEATDAELRATGATISRIRRVLDGEGISEMERLQRRVAELEALLAEKEEI